MVSLSQLVVSTFDRFRIGGSIHSQGSIVVGSCCSRSLVSTGGTREVSVPLWIRCDRGGIARSQGTAGRTQRTACYPQWTHRPQIHPPAGHGKGCVYRGNQRRSPVARLSQKKHGVAEWKLSWIACSARSTHSFWLPNPGAPLLGTVGVSNQPTDHHVGCSTTSSGPRTTK